MFSTRPETSNCRTWLTRIALVAWAVYAFAILLFPLWDEAKERNRAFHRDSAAYEVCKSIAAEHRIPEKQAECESVYRARSDRDAEAYQFGSEYRAMGWHGVWMVAAAVLIPPVIFFVIVYGVVAGLVKVAKWLRRGLDRGLVRSGSAPAIQSELRDLPLTRFRPTRVLPAE